MSAGSRPGGVSGPASNSSTRRSDAADSRLASTQPAAPPPTMMVSKLLVMRDARRRARWMRSVPRTSSQGSGRNALAGAGRLLLGASRRCRRRRLAPVLLEHEAFVIARRRHIAVDGAVVKHQQFVLAAVIPIGRYQIAVVAAGRDAEAVDFAGERRLDREDRVAQGLAFDEIVRELVERAIEIVVDA